MRKLTILLFLFFVSITSQGQEELTWQTDLNKAIEISNLESKPLFLFFTGSDWCGWCIRLQKEVFKTPEFIAWAKDNVVLVELDYPRNKTLSPEIKKQNSELQQFFAVRGYPTVWFAKPTGIVDGKQGFEQLGSTGYLAGGPTVWLKTADTIISKFIPNPKPSKKEIKAAKKKATNKKA